MFGSEILCLIIHWSENPLPIWPAFFYLRKIAENKKLKNFPGLLRWFPHASWIPCRRPPTFLTCWPSQSTQRTLCVYDSINHLLFPRLWSAKYVWCITAFLTPLWSLVVVGGSEVDRRHNSTSFSSKVSESQVIFTTFESIFVKAEREVLLTNCNDGWFWRNSS